MATTPTFRIEIKTEAGIIDCVTWKAGRPNDEHLAAYVAFIESQNDIVVTRAEVVRQANGNVVAEYVA